MTVNMSAMDVKVWQGSLWALRKGMICPVLVRNISGDRVTGPRNPYIFNEEYKDIETYDGIMLYITTYQVTYYHMMNVECSSWMFSSSVETIYAIWPPKYHILILFLNLKWEWIWISFTTISCSMHTRNEYDSLPWDRSLSVWVKAQIRKRF